MEVNNRRVGWVEVFTPYIVRNGKTIYPKNAKFFHFWVRKSK